MIYYIIALTLYSTIFIISAYFTNAKFRRFVASVTNKLNVIFLSIKNSLVSDKGLIVQQINE